jgi:hypothetical protein
VRAGGQVVFWDFLRHRFFSPLRVLWSQFMPELRCVATLRGLNSTSLTPSPTGVSPWLPECRPLWGLSGGIPGSGRGQYRFSPPCGGLAEQGNPMPVAISLGPFTTCRIPSSFVKRPTALPSPLSVLLAEGTCPFQPGLGRGQICEKWASS